jgi:TatD DNase family protein
MKNDYIDIHTHHSNGNHFFIYNHFNIDPLNASNKYCSIGIHPWYINNTNTNEHIEWIYKNVTNKKVIAIGECGLDKSIDKEIDKQIAVFILQINIALKYKKPLIIHCVKAHNELVAIKKKAKIILPMIVHGFNNSKTIALELLKNDFYLSFGKALMTKDSNAQKVIKLCPNNKLFLETDDGKFSIEEIYDAAAKILKLNVSDLQEKIKKNYEHVFNVKENE